MTALLLACVVLLLPRAGPRPDPEPARPSGARSGGVRFDVVAAAAVAVTALVLVPLPWGVLVAGVGAAVTRRVLPREFSRPADDRRFAVSRQLPDCVDLLAALLRAGLTDTEALSLVIGATTGPLNADLHRVEHLRRLGAGPQQAWRAVADDPQLVDLAAAMARHAETGSSVAGLLDRVAADARRDFFTHAQAAARAAAVRAVIPLAACFLPSFVLLGVVPIVASLFSGLTF